MRHLTIIMVWGSLLSAAVMAKSVLPRTGKGLLYQLVQRTPWDVTRLARILQLELDGAVDAADYVPDALNLFQQLIVSIPREEQVQKLLLWEVTTPRGAKHWLWGSWHDVTYRDFSAPAQHELHELLTQIDVLIHEGDIPRGKSVSVESYQQLDHQLIAHARQLGKATTALDTAWERGQINLDEQAILAEREAQQDAKLAALSAAETETLLVDQLVALERQLSLRRAYLQADHAALVELARPRAAAKIFDDTLLHARNYRWITRITAACARDVTCLVSAGYAHLVVDNDDTASIVSLLREQGYGVEPSSSFSGAQK